MGKTTDTRSSWKQATDDQDSTAGATSSETSPPSKLNYRGNMPIDEAVAYFEALTNGLKRGTVTLRQGSETMHIQLGSEVDLEIKATSKKRKGKLTFAISWWTTPANVDFEIT